MDSIHSWIDKEEVSRLAESLSASPERMKEWKTLETDGFAMPEKQGQAARVNETPVPAAPAHAPSAPVVEAPDAPKAPEAPKEQVAATAPIASEVLDKHRSALAGASQLAKSSGLIQAQKTPAVAAEMSIPSYDTELAPPSEIKISRNADPGTFGSVKALLSEELGADGICAIDRDGDVLFDDLDNIALTHFVASVMKSSSLMTVADDEVDGMRIKASGNELLEFISVKSTRGVVLIAARIQQGLSQDQRLDIGKKLLEVLNS